MIEASDILAARILVVDDKEANVRLLEGMLRVAGYTSVDSTMDPAEVCGLHRANRYGLILLDLQMPVMDGFEVMTQLKEMDNPGYLPVLVITAQPDHKLRALEAGARDFVSKPFELAELRARVHNILEVSLYSEALAKTVRELEATREELAVKTAEDERKRAQELTLAQRTQESLLPLSIPSFENYEIAAYNHPTRYVGGDFYDFLETAPGQWMGVLADVSGKGMPAALLSSLILGAVSSEFRAGTPPHEVLHRLNELLCEKSMPAQFVTMFQFLLRADGRGEFISAAHNAAYLFRGSTGKIEELVSNSFFVGMFPAAAWQASPFRLECGDTLVIYSDGLTDAENPKGACFGEDRVKAVIRSGASRGTIKEDLLKAVEIFTEGEPQNDDITFIIVTKTC